MAIAFVNSGANSSGTTSLTPGYAPSVYANALALLVVVNKYPANGPSTPAGWTLVGQASGGAGSAGADSGEVYVTVFKKVLDGTETGTVTVTITGGNSSNAQIYQYVYVATTETDPYTLGDGWLVDMVSGADVSAGTAWSATASTEIELKYGDFVVAATGVNSNLYTTSSTAITAPGLSMPTTTARADFGTAPGDNIRQTLCEAFVLAGRATSTTLSYTATLSGTAGNAPAGVTAFIRLREENLRLKWVA